VTQPTERKTQSVAAPGNDCVNPARAVSEWRSPCAPGDETALRSGMRRRTTPDSCRRWRVDVEPLRDPKRCITFHA